MIDVKLIRKPDEQSIKDVKRDALVTVGKEMVNAPTDEWLFAIADAEHSPIRQLEFKFSISAPYWVLNELRTHHVGCEMLMQSSRNDRQDDFDRNEAPQGMYRECTFRANLQSLMDISHKRLCGNATWQMRRLVSLMCAAVMDDFPWTQGLFMPMCEYRGGHCHEMKSCGRCQR